MTARWRDLFTDLEGQFDAEARAADAAEIADRTRREAARLDLLSRLSTAVGSPLRVAVLDAGDNVVAGLLADTGPDWLLLEVGPAEVVVPTHALAWVEGVPPRAADPEARGAVAQRLRLGYVLRAIARDRSPVRVRLLDGSTVVGTVDRVYLDSLDLAVHPAGEVRRRSAVRAVRTIPLAALAWITRSTG